VNRIVLQKRIGIVFFAIISFATCVWLASRWKDAEIRRNLPGTWTADWNEDFTWKMGPKPTGSFSKLYMGGAPKGWSADGTWNVHRGFIVLTMTNHPLKGYPPIETYKLIQIDDRRMILNVGGDSEPQTLHKK